jgi:hypothetical protein
VIQHRFPDSENLKKDVPEDIIIRDIDDQQGLRIEAKTEILSRLRAVFESFFPETIFRPHQEKKMSSINIFISLKIAVRQFSPGGDVNAKLAPLFADYLSVSPVHTGRYQ